MTDDEIRARFDGRSRVELLLGPVSASKRERIERIAHALGYRLLSMQNQFPRGLWCVFERDDSPLARRATSWRLPGCARANRCWARSSRPHPRRRLRRRRSVHSHGRRGP
jgi:hypothetical protein